MTRAHHREADSPAGDLLPLERPAARHVRVETIVADVVRALGAERPRGPEGRPQVRIDCDVAPSTTIDRHATDIRRLLESLVREAVAAAIRVDHTASTPPLREVVVTAIDTGTTLEIEVADSGPPHAVARTDMLAAERIGGRLESCDCPEGGTAVTFILPHRPALARAA